MYENKLPIYDREKCFLFALGRNAIYAACQILGLRDGDEVLTPAFDCDGSLQPFRVLGLELSFFRSDPYTFAADIDDIRRKITPKTKLLHVINHFGLPQPWDKLLAIREETGVPILEDNAYSLFSKVNNRLFGTFGDISIFSLRKNLPLTEGGMLRINNPKYKLIPLKEETRYCYPTEYLELLRLATRNIKFLSFVKSRLKKFYPLSEPPPPLYSETGSGFAHWPARDVIGREFSCDYLRPMSRLVRNKLSRFTQSDFTQIGEKKRYYYDWLSKRLEEMEGIKILWPELPKGIVPFCLFCVFDSKRDFFLESLRKKYEVMAWPTLSRVILDRLADFPEVELLGRKLLQINLPADKVRLPYFASHLENLVRDIAKLLNGIPLDNRNK